MATFTSDITLDVDSDVSSVTDIGQITYNTVDTPNFYIDDNTNISGSSFLGNFNEPDYGGSIRADASITLSSGTSLTATSLYLTSGTSSGNAPGGFLRLNGATFNTSQLYSSQLGSGISLPTTAANYNALSATDRAKWPHVYLTDSQITINGSHRAGWRSVVGNLGCIRWVLDNSNIVIQDTTDVPNGGGNWYGTNIPIFYLGHFSDMRNVTISGAFKYELMTDFTRFENVSFIFPDGRVGNSNSDGVLYLGADRGIQITLATPPTASFVTASDKPNSYKYYGHSSASSTVTFLTGIPSDVRSWEIGFNTGGATFQNANDRNSYQQILFRAQLNAHIRRNTGTDLVNHSGANVLFYDKYYGLLNNVSDSNGLIGQSNPQYYTWYEAWGNSFSNEGGHSNHQSSLIGWPDRHGTRIAEGGNLRVSNNTDLAAIVADLNNTSIGGTHSINAEIDDPDSAVGIGEANNCTRYYPFYPAVIDYGYYPVVPTTALGGTTQMSITNPTKQQVLDSDATADDVKSGYNIEVTLNSDPALQVTSVNTLAKAVALSGFTFTAPTATTNLGIRNAGAVATDLINLYAKSVQWVHQNYNAADTMIIPNPSGDSYEPDRRQGTGSSGVSVSNGEVKFFSAAAASQASTNVLAVDTGSDNGGLVSSIVSMRISLNNSGGTNTRPLGFFNEAFGRYFLFWSSTSDWFYGKAIGTRGSNSDTGAINFEVLGQSNSSLQISNANYYVLHSDVLDKIPGIQRVNHSKQYLQDVEFAPMTSAGSVIMTRSVTVEGQFEKDDTFTTISLDTHSDYHLRSQNLGVNVTKSGSGSNPRVHNFNTNSSASAPAVADGVVVGAGIDLEFARGSTYYIEGDISAANITTTGSSGNVTLILVGSSAAVPSSLPANVVSTKTVTVNFVGNTTTLSNRPNRNFVAYTGTGSGNAVADSNIVSTRSNTMLSYSITVPANATVYWAFGGRVNSSLVWYELAAGEISSGSVTHDLVGIPEASVPAATPSGASAIQSYYFNNDTRVSHNNILISGLNPLTIDFPSTAYSGNSAAGRWVHRYVQQQTPYLEAVAKKWLPVNNWRFTSDDVRYDNTGIVWQKDTANNNLVKFDTPVLNLDGATASVTTTNIQTELRWSGAVNVGVLTPGQFEIVQGIDRTTKATLGQVL